MEPSRAADPKLLAHYEGLVKKTSSRYVNILNGMDFEDIAQVLRVKVWKSLVAFDPSRYKPSDVDKARDSFVFGCVRNQAKDLVKRNKEKSLYIEDVAPARIPGAGAAPRDRFEQRYLQVEDAFREIEDAYPDLPGTLTDDERHVLACMYLGYNQPETALKLGIDRRKVSLAVRNIRKKMEDWQPKFAEREKVAA